MLKQNKNSIYSFLSLIFVVISYIGLDKLMYSNFYIQGNSLTSKFDWFFFSLTKYKWNYASGDILYYLALLIPFIFLILSVFWGIKMLKNKENISSKFRILGLVSLTISSFILITFLILKLAFWGEF